MIDWKQMPEGKEKYQAYLCSPDWARLRIAVKERCGDVCERCRQRPVQQVHHRTYIRQYNERLTDLEGLCEPCHTANHRPRPERPVVESFEMAPAWIVVAWRELMGQDASPRSRALTKLTIIRRREIERCALRGQVFVPLRRVLNDQMRLEEATIRNRRRLGLTDDGEPKVFPESGRKAISW